MKLFIGALIVALLAACQPENTDKNVYIIDGQKTIHLQSGLNTPAEILDQAGIVISEGDAILFHGAFLPLDFTLPPGRPYTFDIQRTHILTLVAPNKQMAITTTAATVGEALAETGMQVNNTDFITPPLNTPILSNMKVDYQPAQDYVVIVDGKTTTVKSSQNTIGQVLVTSGFALSGLDKSIPSEMEQIQPGGQIQLTRSYETITLKQTTIPFANKYDYLLDLAAGEQKVLQAGEFGLKVSRIRTLFADGIEISNRVETEKLIRQPKDAVIALSTQVQINSIDTPSGPIQYWRAVQMYATAYSPCRSGTPTCQYGTASGLPVKQGVVAMTRSLYNQLAGTQVYIPGYGIGIIGDVGGGFPDGRLWIDLGYSDDDYQSWSGVYTVYFLAPAPASIPSELK